MLKVTHKGYTLTQDGRANYHFMITDSNNELRMHSQCERKLTEEDAIQAIERFIKISEACEQIWREEYDKA